MLAQQCPHQPGNVSHCGRTCGQSAFVGPSNHGRSAVNPFLPFTGCCPCPHRRSTFESSCELGLLFIIRWCKLASINIIVIMLVNCSSHSSDAPRGSIHNASSLALAAKAWRDCLYSFLEGRTNVHFAPCLPPCGQFIGPARTASALLTQHIVRAHCRTNN